MKLTPQEHAAALEAHGHLSRLSAQLGPGATSAIGLHLSVMADDLDTLITDGIPPIAHGDCLPEANGLMRCFEWDPATDTLQVEHIAFNGDYSIETMPVEQWRKAVEELDRRQNLQDPVHYEEEDEDHAE